MNSINKWLRLFTFLLFSTNIYATQYSSNWGTAPWTWTDGVRNDTINIASGLTATIDFSTSANGSWDGGYGVVTAYIDSASGTKQYFGGIPDLGAIFDPDAGEGNSRVIITLTFSQPIYNASFLISDIDSSGTARDDKVTINSDVGTPVLTAVNPGSNKAPIINGNSAQTADNGGSNNDDTASIRVAIPDGTTTITVWYDEVSGVNNPPGRGMGIFGEMSFSDGGSISGHLYNDTNGNGSQDAGEPNLANVDVKITDAKGNVKTVSTDANGDYQADKLAPGQSFSHIPASPQPSPSSS